MAVQFGKNGRRVAAAAVLSLAMSGMMAMAQDNSGQAPAAQQGDQQGPPPGGHHGRGGESRQIDMMTKRLNLTPDQATQVKAIMDDARTQGKAVHEDTTLSDSDKHAKMMTVHQAAQTKVRALLNDDQKTKFDAMAAERQQHMHHGEDHGGSGDAPPPPPPA